MSETFEIDYMCDDEKTIKIEIICDEIESKGKCKQILYKPIYINSNWVQTSFGDKMPKRAQQLLKSYIKNKYTDKFKSSFQYYMTIKALPKIVATLLQNQECGNKMEAIFQNLFDAITNDTTANILASEISLYANEYMQYKPEIQGIEREKIETCLKNFQEYLKTAKIEAYRERFEKNFLFSDFEKMMLTQECYYCGISVDEIERLRENNKIFSKSGRGFNLEIERKNAFLEYTKENSAMACYWCNNAKSDEYTVDEFKGIAESIHNTWKKRGAVGIKDFKDIVTWKEI